MNQTASFFSTRFPGPRNAWWSYRRKRFWLLIILLTYTLVGFLLVPWVVKRQATNFVSENLGMQLQLEQVKFNPWALTAEIKGMAIGEGGQDAMLGFDRLFVNFQTSSLFRWAFTFNEVTLDHPYGQIVQNEQGELNLLALIPPTDESAPTPAEPEGESGPLRWLVTNIGINNGDFAVRDETRPTPFVTKIEPINISVNELTTLPERTGGQQVSITTESGAQLNWSGTISLEPLMSSGQVSASGPYPALGYQYFQDLLNFELRDGTIDLALDYTAQLNAESELQLEINNAGLQLRNVVVVQDGPNQGVEIVNIPEISVENGVMNLAEQRLSVAAVTVSQPRFQLWRTAQGQFNVQQLITEAEAGNGVISASEQSAADPESESDWLIELEEFRIEGLATSAIDYSVGEDASIELTNFDLSVQNISNQPLASFPVTLSMALSSGGNLEASGDVTVLPEPAANLQLNLSDLALAVGQPWLEQIARLQIDSGSLNVTAQVAVSPENPLSLQADVSLPEFRVSDLRIAEQLVGWDNIGVNQIVFNLNDNQLDISQIEWDAPFAAFHIAEDRSTNLQGLLLDAAPETEPASPEAITEVVADSDTDNEVSTNGPVISVGQIDIRDGLMEFSDLSLPLPFATTITELGGEISTISSTSAEPANVNLSGVVNEYGLAEISGRIRPLSPMELTDISVLFRNVSMPDLTPYTIRFAGREIADGRLQLDLHYLIEQGQLNAENSVVMSDLRLGEAVEYPDAVNLPLGLAVALLKGPDGTIDIDLPVTGSVNDPEFSIGGVIFRAFVNLITRAATAPFSLLGNLVGAGGDDFGRVEFRPGVSELAPPDREKLDQLAEALLQRPGLALDLKGVIDPVADTSALKTARIQADIAARLEALPQGGAQSLFVSRRRQVLEALAGERLSVDLQLLRMEHQLAANPDQPTAAPVLDEPAYLAVLQQQLSDAEQISDSDLDLLSQARATAMYDQLMAGGQLDASRVQQSGETVESELDEDGWITLELEVTAN